MINFIPNKKSLEGGVSFVEMIIYLALLTVFTFVIVDAMIGFSSSYRALKTSKLLTDSAMITFERISRAARDSHAVNLVGSVLGVSPGRVELLTVDDFGTPLEVAFALEDGLVVLYENDIYKGPLSALNASTTELVFRVLESGRTTALRIEMSVTAKSGAYIQSENFQDTVILRNSI